MPDRLAQKYVCELNSGCWIWIGANNGKYGVIWSGGPRGVGRQTYAHRVSWKTFRGNLPDTLTIDHLCKVKLCINPDHLEPVTMAENMARAKRTYCKYGHLKTAMNKKGYLECRTCAREHMRRQRGATEVKLVRSKHYLLAHSMLGKATRD